jgi:hypothetical protein
MMKRILLWIFVLSFLSWQGYRYWPVTVHIRSADREKDFSIRMPLKDKQRLDFFFREVCFFNVWAYTLLGSKPSSIDQYTNPWVAFKNGIKHPDFFGILHLCFWPPHYQRIYYLLTPRQLKIKWGWEALKKYFHRFPNSRFALYESCSLDHEIVGLTLVDKKQMIALVREHFEDFQDALKNQGIEPEELIDHAKLWAFMRCLGDEEFAGTLLGYGRGNARLYAKWRESDSSVCPMESAWPEEQLVNLEQVNQRTMAFQPWELSDMFYPRFACDPESEETKQLKVTYRKEREKIIQYFEGKDLVEAALSLFNQE